MTTDDFTTAARAEAQLASLDRNGRIGGVGDLGVHMAEWARDHLAAPETPLIERILAVMPEGGRRHWEHSEEGRAKYADRGCACDLCLTLAAARAAGRDAR